MKHLIILTMAIWLVPNHSHGQVSRPDLSKINDATDWQISNRKVEASGSGEQTSVMFDARQGDGIAIYQHLEFSDGTIDVDIKGKDVFQQSFVGVAFHIQDEKSFNAVYFRPFNFRSEDSARKNHAVQYICHPQFTWQKLRAEYPEKYENPVNPVPDPAQYFHATIVVQAPDVKVYVNHSPNPCLEVQLLGNYTRGKIGLWAGNGSDGTFKNLMISPFIGK